MVSTKNIDQVQDIVHLLEKSKNFALIKFDRTTHKKLETLRRELKQFDAKFKVIKNTLLEKAVNKLSNSDNLMSDFHKKAFPNTLTTALLTFNSDWDKGLSEFYKFAKEDKTLSFKIGILDNQVYLADKLNRIAELPSREVLVGKLLGSIKAPLNNLVYSMKFNMQKFVYVLNAKAKK